ncbi:hypothetical protein [Chondrinema litorale]|uniref:hypothetical protein n=1 Tax=Chondrinema litorale TaxID=2994555 RepID=UPI00254288A3|nr:hypothetical protein [Chondrinema litorale]UZR97370.1 hypothetical protein OQ292_26060 [Chondrinema litorale]
MEDQKKKSILNFKVLFNLLFVFFLASSAYAQNGAMADMTSEEKAELLTEKQKEKIEFYDDQEEKMYDVNLKYVKEMESIVAEGRSMSTLNKLQSMSGKKDKEVKEILDKDQYKTYLKMKEDVRQEMRNRRGSGNWK